MSCLADARRRIKELERQYAEHIAALEAQLAKERDDARVMLAEMIRQRDEVTVERIALKTQVERLTSENKEYEATFDLQWKANRRAVDLYRAAHPESKRRCPDHAKNVFWLLERVDSLEEELAKYKDEPLDPDCQEFINELFKPEEFDFSIDSKKERK